MPLSDCAIVGYAETKIVDKTDKDVWELGAEVLESILASTKLEKQAIDGLILSSSMTGTGSAFWSQLTADALALELNFCQTVDIGGSSPLGAVARACMAINEGLCENVLCLFADTQSFKDLCASQFIEAVQMSYTGASQQVIPFLHGINGPGQYRFRFFHVGDDRVHEVWNAFVGAEFHHFGVDHQHPDFVGSAGHQERDDQCIQADAFAGSSASGDQQVWHFGEVNGERAATDILTKEQGQSE